MYVENTFKSESTQTLTLNTLTSIAASYFFSKQIDSNERKNSPFISGGIGYADLFDGAYRSNDETRSASFFVGVGYELSKHFRVSLNYYHNHHSFTDYGDSYTKDSDVFLVSFSTIAF